MIKIVCDVCGTEEAATALSPEWRTVSSISKPQAETSEDSDDSVQLCSATCVARWAGDHGAESRPSDRARDERGMADQMKRAMKRQIDLRLLDESEHVG